MLQHNAARKVAMMAPALVAAGIVCLLVCAVGSADDKTAPGQSERVGDQAAARSGSQQWAQNQNQWAQHSGEELEKADSLDKLFLIGCAEQDIFALLLTQAAQQNAQSDKVRQLARRLHQDHEQLTRQVQKLIEQQGLIMPQGISPILQQELKLIRAQQGEEFDVAFVSAAKATHAKALSKLEDMSKTAKDPAVRQFAAQSLTMVREHAREIRESAVAVGLPATSGEARPAGERIPAGEK
jgi:predicted outer membrane protein